MSTEILILRGGCVEQQPPCNRSNCFFWVVVLRSELFHEPRGWSSVYCSVGSEGKFCNFTITSFTKTCVLLGHSGTATPSCCHNISCCQESDELSTVFYCIWISKFLDLSALQNVLVNIYLGSHL